jgi:hypothetical protein
LNSQEVKSYNKKWTIGSISIVLLLWNIKSWIFYTNISNTSLLSLIKNIRRWNLSAANSENNGFAFVSLSNNGCTEY